MSDENKTADAVEATEKVDAPKAETVDTSADTTAESSDAPKADTSEAKTEAPAEKKGGGR